jgi:hypothetical protein
MSDAIISYGPKLGLLNNATINEIYYDQFRPFLRGMDALIQIAVISIRNSQPSSPSDGDSYIIGTSPSGIWSGKANQLAVYSSQITQSGSNTLIPGWDYYIPTSGWIAYIIGTGFVYYNGSDWVTLSTGSSTSKVNFDSSDTAFAGDFQIAHGLSFIPTTLVPVMTSDGRVWLQSISADSTYLYLVASDAGITGYVVCS